MTKPTLASFYSGCGGSAKGFDDAGFKIVFMNDISKDACKSLRLNFKNGNEEIVHLGDIRKKEIAEKIGLEIAKRSIAKGIKSVVFDKGKYKYHGIIKIFAESARNAGLEFWVSYVW